MIKEIDIPKRMIRVEISRVIGLVNAYNAINIKNRHNKIFWRFFKETFLFILIIVQLLISTDIKNTRNITAIYLLFFSGALFRKSTTERESNIAPQINVIIDFQKTYDVGIILFSCYRTGNCG
jgi:hypothetical protein